MEDKEQLSIQTHVHTHTYITYRQMTKRNINLSQEVISGLGEKNKEVTFSSCISEETDFFFLFFKCVSGERRKFPAGGREGKTTMLR